MKFKHRLSRAGPADELWEKILSALDQDQQWRNPEFTLIALSQQVCSNRTYVGEAFKRNAGLTFSEYMAKKRIGYVVSVLKENPNTDIKDLFHYVGYRSRTAGWRISTRLQAFPQLNSLPICKRRTRFCKSRTAMPCRLVIFVSLRMG